MNADDFIYPSLEERKQILKNYPLIKKFYLTHTTEYDAISRGLPLVETSRIGNLCEWNMASNNRFENLRETYVYMMTNYNRQFAGDVYSNSLSKRHVNYFLFNYYAEIFYYFFFSSKELIGQVLRVYYRVDTPEDNFNMDNNKKFRNELKKYPLVEAALDAFATSISTSAKIRNKFVHKFTPTLRDRRSTYTESNGNKMMQLGIGDTGISPSKVVNDAKELLTALGTLMETLVVHIK